MPDTWIARSTWRWLRETSTLGVVITNNDLLVQGWNRWMEERSDLTAAEVQGRSLLDIYPHLASATRTSYEAALRGESRLLAQRFHRNMFPMQAPSLSPQRQMEQKVVIAPLWDGDQILGTITVIDDVTRRVLQEEMLQKQIDELEQVRAELDRSGRDLAVALAYERDLVQVFVRSLLQDCPNDARFDLACRYYPAYTQEHIGGDFYDFVRFGDGAMGVVIGDVCGKGMRAAVYTAMAKYTFRAFALEDAAPAAVMMRLNRCLYQQIVEAGMFMSFTYVFVDIAQGRLRWANAGHPAAVLVDPRGQTEYLTATGPVIGAFEDVSFREGSASFEPGSVLALYTDGVTEADRREEEGERVVEQVVRQNSGLGADGIADLLHEYAEVASRGQLRDDIAIVVVRYPEDRS